MSTRENVFIGGPLDGRRIPATARGRHSIYLDDEGNRLPPAKANPRLRGYYSHQTSRNGDLYIHNTVPHFAPPAPHQAIRGATGWSMQASNPTFLDRISTPSWNEASQRWEARILEEEYPLDEPWRYAPIGTLVFPTAVEWGRNNL